MLDIASLKGTSKEEQLKAAAEYAGVPVGYVSGQWKAESNQGQHPTMIGPQTKWGTAKGHFQVLDNTHAAIEQRIGKKLDRFDFTEALVGYAEIMKENVNRYGNADDAVNAYHGGWNKKNWGPVTKDYLAKVKDYAGVAGDAALGQPSGVPASKRNPTGISTEQWMAGTGPVTAADARSALADTAVRVAVAAAPGVRMAQTGTVEPTELAQRQATGTALAAEQTKKDEQSFIDTARAGYRETMRPTFNVMAHILSTDDGTDKDYIASLAADPSQVLKLVQNPTPEEVATLLDTRSQEDLTLALGNINDRRENQAVLARAGTGGQLAAMFIGGALDPTTYITGFGAAKSFAAAGLGATRLIAAGKPLTAVASVAGENVLGNVAYEGVQHLLGEHKSVADYGMAAATGLIPAAISAPGAWREGIFALQRKQEAQSLLAQAEHIERAVKALGPDADPDEIRVLAAQYEAQALREDKVGRTAMPDRDNTLNAPDLDAQALDTAPEAPKPAAMPKEDMTAFDAKSVDPDRAARMDMSLEDNVVKYGVTRTADEIRALPAGVHLGKDVADNAVFQRVQGLIEQVRQKYLPDTALHIQRGNAAAGPDSSLSAGPGKHIIFLTENPQIMSTAVHEVGHVVFETYAAKLPPELRAAMRADWQAWVKDFEAGGGKDVAQRRLGATRADTGGVLSGALKGDVPNLRKALEGIPGPGGKSYADYFKSLDEFSAEQFVKQIEAEFGTTPAKTPMGKALQDLAYLVKMVKGVWEDMVKAGTLSPTESYAEFFARVAARDLEASAGNGQLQSMAVPAQSPHTANLMDVMKRYGLDTMDVTDARGRAEQKAIAQLIYDSEQWLKANPQDKEKMRTIMRNSLFDARTSGLILAESDNPVLKAVAGILVENTMGGSGRNVTAALRKAQWEREFIGNSVIAIGSHYKTYRNKRLGVMKGTADDLGEARTRKEFNDAVYMEVNARSLKQELNSAPEVKAAADALEVSYERMLKAQKDVRTVGWGALPDNSVGYMPRVTDKRMWLTLSTERKQALHKALAEQFVERGDMDEAFAQRVASKYLDHISTNANGGHEIPANVHDPMALDYVQEAMKAAGMTEAEVRDYASRMARGGPSHTKARLDLDVLKEYKDAEGKTFSLMDIMETDPVELLRGQARRVSGEVALTQHRVMGSAGLKLLRRAAEKAQQAGDAGHVKGMEAFDQVAAEMLGRPFGDEMPTWMEGALTANAVSNQGFMGWMQMGELINTAAGLGVLDTMKMVSDFPRLMQEVKVLAKGGKVENGILGSLEVSGAEFGLAGYKMITQYDNPSSIHAAVGRQDSGTLIKGVRVMGHKLGTVSLHRIIQATQVRGVAEQITKKSLRFINEGKESKALADMGFTPSMVERIKAELPRIAKFDANGTLASLDMTKASDPALVGDYIATINRGAGQLIQDTFIGEKGKWQHSNLGKVMTQFRSFPITAMEKQWGRMRGMHGAPAALGIIMAAAPMAFALYAVRTAINAVGRPDSDEYIEKQFQPLAVGRGLMNYIGALGLAPDMMDAFTAVAVPDDIKKEWGLQNRAGQSPTVGGIVPIVGYGDTWLKAANNLDNPHALVRALPFSNAPWTVPLINLLRPDQ